MKHQLQSCLTQNILPFWMDKMVDEERGGFYGQMTGEGRLVKDAPKGAILNARILWTFSAAYRVLGRPEYLTMADRALDYILRHFIDREHGGVFWSVDADGRPLDTKKQTYAIAFTIYGLAEYLRATAASRPTVAASASVLGDSFAEPAIAELAISLFHDIEAHAFDAHSDGYIEAFSRTWGEADDLRLSDKDEPERKTMNTHLHVLEAYTNLLRVWPSAELRRAHRHLISLFTRHIIDRQTGHLRLFFTDDWHSPYNYISYGHDIEASWLLREAAQVQGDPDLLATIAPIADRIADAATEGLTPEGALIYELKADAGIPSPLPFCRTAGVSVDTELHWWVQAEAIVGWTCAGRADIARRAWDYVKQHLIDRDHGEWHWSILPDGTVNRRDDKAGFWKCPYHNSRACLSFLE